VKILVRATNWVGDAILAMPALRAVREKCPEASISVVARPYVAEIYRDQDVCDELIEYDAKGAHRGWSGRERIIRELRARKFDVALLLQNAFDAAWLVWRAGIPKRIGYARDGRSLLLTQAIAVPRTGEIPGHEKFYYLELLKRAEWLEKLPEVEEIRLRVPEEKRARAEEKLVEAGARSGARRADAGRPYPWRPDPRAVPLAALRAVALRRAFRLRPRRRGRAASDRLRRARHQHHPGAARRAAGDFAHRAWRLTVIASKSEAIQTAARLDCLVTKLLAMTRSAAQHQL